MRARSLLTVLAAVLLALPQGGCLLIYLITSSSNSAHETALYENEEDLWSVHPEERRAAAQLLGRLSRVSGPRLRYLSRLAYDTDETVRTKARTALSTAAPKHVSWIRNHLESDLEEGQTDGKSVWEAFAYGTVRGPIDALVPQLTKIATEGEEGIQVGAILALAAHDKAPAGSLESVVRSLRAHAEHDYTWDDGPEEALMALGFMGAEAADAIQVIEAYAKSSTASERWAAEWALPRVRGG